MLAIREAAAADADAIASIYAPYVCDTVISFEVVPPSAEEMAGRMRGMMVAYPWLVCTDRSTVVGYAYASRHRDRAAYQWSVDVSIYIRTDAHRHGIGRALYSALLRIVAAQGFYNAYGGITLPNPASVGLHEALGFRAIGVYRAVGYKLGAWHDVGWWDLMLSERPATPAAPLSIDAVRASPAWTQALAVGQALLRP